MTFQISDKLAANIRKDYLVQSKTEKCFVVFRVLTADYVISSASEIKLVPCFQNNPGLIYSLNNCTGIPMLVFQANGTVTISRLTEPKAKPKKGFGK